MLAAINIFTAHSFHRIVSLVCFVWWFCVYVFREFCLYHHFDVLVCLVIYVLFSVVVVVTGFRLVTDFTERRLFDLKSEDTNVDLNQKSQRFVFSSDKTTAFVRSNFQFRINLWTALWTRHIFSVFRRKYNDVKRCVWPTLSLSCLFMRHAMPKYSHQFLSQSNALFCFVGRVPTRRRAALSRRHACNTRPRHSQCCRWTQSCGHLYTESAERTAHEAKTTTAFDEQSVVRQRHQQQFVDWRQRRALEVTPMNYQQFGDAVYGGLNSKHPRLVLADESTGWTQLRLVTNWNSCNEYVNERTMIFCEFIGETDHPQWAERFRSYAGTL